MCRSPVPGRRPHRPRRRPPRAPPARAGGGGFGAGREGGDRGGGRAADGEGGEGGWVGDGVEACDVQIYVDDVDGDTLLLHHEHDGKRDLEITQATKVIEHAMELWKKEVKLITIVDDAPYEI